LGLLPQAVLKISRTSEQGDLVYAVFGFGTVLAVFGNLLVMTSILHFKQLQSPANFLIASLACADFCVGVAVMPFSMVRSVESCWYFGRSFCAFHTCCDVAFCYSSLFHLCFISIDRYIAVTDPLTPSSRCLCQEFALSSPGSCLWCTVILCSTQVSIMMGWRNYPVAGSCKSRLNFHKFSIFSYLLLIKFLVVRKEDKN
jgi:hypothetical protein